MTSRLSSIIEAIFDKPIRCGVMESFSCQAALTEKRCHVGTCIRTKHEDKFRRC